jgi:hypothetical protein
MDKFIERAKLKRYEDMSVHFPPHLYDGYVRSLRRPLGRGLWRQLSAVENTILGNMRGTDG